MKHEMTTEKIDRNDVKYATLHVTEEWKYNIVIILLVLDVSAKADIDKIAFLHITVTAGVSGLGDIYIYSTAVLTIVTSNCAHYSCTSHPDTGYSALIKHCGMMDSVFHEGNGQINSDNGLP